MLKIVLVFLLVFTSDLSFSKAKAQNFIPSTFKARFEQVYKGSLRGKVKKSDGLIEYKYPGNIRVEITDPNESLIFVSNQKKTWYYRPPFLPDMPGELSVKPRGNVVVAKFFDVLKRGLKSNKKYKVKVDKKNKSDRIILFEKKVAKELGVNQAVLRTKKKSIKAFSDVSSVDLTYSDGKTVKLNLSNLVVGKKIAKDRFVFEVPENTNITN